MQYNCDFISNKEKFMRYANKRISNIKLMFNALECIKGVIQQWDGKKFGKRFLDEVNKALKDCGLDEDVNVFIQKDFVSYITVNVSEKNRWCEEFGYECSFPISWVVELTEDNYILGDKTIERNKYSFDNLINMIKELEDGMENYDDYIALNEKFKKVVACYKQNQNDLFRFINLNNIY